MKLHMQAIKAFNDNYIWFFKNPSASSAICIDPGDANPVLEVLKREKLQLSAILITHHHWDHTGGIAALREHYNCSVYAPKIGAIEACTHAVSGGDVLEFEEFGLNFTVLEIPGHTLDHVAYYGQGRLFCGDTLFAGGCGRLFEGSAEQMFGSLSRLAALPEATEVYCAHEYTEANLQFASHIEPSNQELLQRYAEIKQLRQHGQISLPSTIALEKATNPFLRCHLATIQKAASEHCGKTINDPVAIFAAIREWKNSFVA